ncbi:hypothetical protein [Halosegnis sp.]|uniref:hypothetical protein n=1 Tax=Halosegnis sp. TaxID=2864959 RepID=UPI0035D4589D
MGDAAPPDDPDDDPGSGWHTSRRRRSPSLVRLFALLVVVGGLLLLGYVLAVLYVPNLDPTDIQVGPLYGLTNLAIAAIGAILFGGLTYLYASRAGV